MPFRRTADARARNPLRLCLTADRGCSTEWNEEAGRAAVSETRSTCAALVAAARFRAPAGKALLVECGGQDISSVWECSNWKPWRRWDLRSSPRRAGHDLPRWTTALWVQPERIQEWAAALD